MAASGAVLPGDCTMERAGSGRRTAVTVVAVVAAWAGAGSATGAVGAGHAGGGDATGVGVATVAVAAAIAAVGARRRPSLAAALAGLAVVYGLLAWTPAAQPIALAAWLVLGLALPAGRLSGWRRLVAAGTVVAALAWSGWLAYAAADANPAVAPIAAAASVVALVVPAGVLAACRRVAPTDRSTLQWTAAGVVLAGAVAGVAAALHALAGIPAGPGTVAVAGLALIPFGIAAGVGRRTGPLGAAVLTEAVVGAGLAVFVAFVYLVVVIGLGRTPSAAERGPLGLSLAAAAVVAVLALPVRSRLHEATALLLSEGGASPADVLTGFGARMTRAVPMDELLLQMAESLRATLGPAGAEVWVGEGGVMKRTVSVPDRPPAQLRLAEQELAVAGRARVAGNAWLAVWAPALLDRRPDELVRMAPIAHLGDLLGLIVVARPPDARPFGEEDDRLLSDLARQVGLALHNVRLDSALQQSLEQLRRRNADLTASRARVVAAADESRQRIERDLHDGAQQHLVGIAVKLGLVRQLADDPEGVAELLGELRSDVQAAIGELRELAHGIYPPLLRQRGLGEALQAAAARCPLAAELDVQLSRRYPAEAEAAVYFCCLEALQNAGKHAGADASVTVEVCGDERQLRFEVRDDGVGFTVGTTGGAGFVNMADRVGAIGGELSVRSAHGAGTTVSGVLPAAPAAPTR